MGYNIVWIYYVFMFMEWKNNFTGLRSDCFFFFIIIGYTWNIVNKTKIIALKSVETRIVSNGYRMPEVVFRIVDQFRRQHRNKFGVNNKIYIWSIHKRLCSKVKVLQRNGGRTTNNLSRRSMLRISYGPVYKFDTRIWQRRSNEQHEQLYGRGKA